MTKGEWATVLIILGVFFTCLGFGIYEVYLSPSTPQPIFTVEYMNITGYVKNVSFSSSGTTVYMVSATTSFVNKTNAINPTIVGNMTLTYQNETVIYIANQEIFPLEIGGKYNFAFVLSTNFPQVTQAYYWKLLSYRKLS